MNVSNFLSIVTWASLAKKNTTPTISSSSSTTTKPPPKKVRKFQYES